MGPTKPLLAGPVLLNNTPLTNFAIVRRPDLIFDLWPGAVCTTPEVVAEYNQAVVSGKLPADLWAGLPVVMLTVQEIEFANQLPGKLGDGERACLAVAYHRQGLLVTDDLEARHIAQSYLISISGTIGILVNDVRQGLLTLIEANRLLTLMIASDYRAPVQRLDGLI